MVKASPASSLVMAESEFLLEFLVVALDPPAQLGEIDEFVEWNVLRQRGEPVFGRLFLVFRPFDQQPLFGSAFLEPFVAMGGAHAKPCIARCEQISRAEEWLLIEWPEDEKEPTKYWFATLPENIPFNELVDLAKLRWRIERDYQDLKQELGLGHYEGRGWRGFHHHATLCIAAYGFLISERETIPPSGPCVTQKLPPLAVPDGYRSRGAADPTRTTHLKLDRHHATTSHRRPRQEPRSMSMLQRAPQNR